MSMGGIVATEAEDGLRMTREMSEESFGATSQVRPRLV
jgi:hypothetical protein